MNVLSITQATKKHKRLKKSTPGMDFDSYSNRFSNLTKYSNELFNYA